MMIFTGMSSLGKRIHFVPSDYFALESHHTKIAQLMREFLAGVVQ